MRIVEFMLFIQGKLMGLKKILDFAFKRKDTPVSARPQANMAPKPIDEGASRYTAAPRFQKQQGKEVKASLNFEGFELQTFLTATHLIDYWEVVNYETNPSMRAILGVVKAEADSVINKKISRAVNLLSGFSHPNMVAFWGEGKGECKGDWQQYQRYGDKIYYTIAEHIQGGTLKERLAAEQGEQLPIIEVVYIAIDTLYALEFLTYLNLVHRNIKPANIMVDRRGVAKLTGFHLLKETKGATLTDDDQALTRGGISLGTPEYMSLEQCKDAAHVDGRADIYSLGVVIYQMLTGSSPFRGKNLNETFSNIKNLRVPPPRSIRSDIPEDLENIALKALERDINKRYQHPTEFRRDLESLL